MKYIEVIENLKAGWGLRYHSNGFVCGIEVSIGDHDWNEVYCLHHNTVRKLLKLKHKFITVWMEGSEDGGFLIIEDEE
ncbi:MAG: hypothetical protein PVH88_02010 [Ignavibacteria bacterium]|jgi:hypothetical protein